MLLTLSIPTPYPEDIVRQAAAIADAHARIKWGHPSKLPHVPAECRFRLTMARDREASASSAQHDVFIRALFEQDPNATIRTARAVYESQKDFLAQCAARVD